MKLRFFKAKTETATNYVTVIDGLCFVIRKNNINNWRIYAYKDTLVGTDNYICPITSQYFPNKKDAVSALIETIQETPKGFYHEIKTPH